MVMNSVQLESHEDGVIVPIRAKPAARRNGIDGTHDGAVRISVTAAPEKGKANKAIAELLAQMLKLRKSDVRLLSGETSANKRFLVAGATVEEVRGKLERAASDK